MNEQLDPQLTRMFTDYAPALESSEFLAQLQQALDRSQRRAWWRSAVSWTAIASVVAGVSIMAGGPLGRLVAATGHAASALEPQLPVSITPLNATLLAILVGLCLHRRIRSLLAPF
jgi:hypothetical protein